MTLPEKLIALRRRAGLSQEQLAETLEVSRQAVSKWETGEAMPDSSKLLPLSRALGVTVDFLLDDSRKDFAPSAGQEKPSLAQRLRQLWRRYGYWSGYALSLYGGVRLVQLVGSILLVQGMLHLGAAGLSEFEVSWTGVLGSALSGILPIGTVLWVSFIGSGLVDVGLILAGIWLARWLRRKYQES